MPVSLTPLEAALVSLLNGVGPVAPSELPLAQTLGCFAANVIALPTVPTSDLATADGWAFRSRDLVGASSYSPLPLTGSPVWVEAGDRMPEGCDCVVDSDLVEASGAMFQVSAEAMPGQGVRRVGEDLAENISSIATGQRIRAVDLLMLRSAGLEKLAVRRPRIGVINIPAARQNGLTTQLIADCARDAGTEVIRSEAAGRDAFSIVRAFDDVERCDLIITIGGTGVGRTDAAMEAIAKRGTLLVHGIALQPGRTSAIGRIGEIPVIALPGAPDQALAGWWTMALPVLQRLASSRPRQPATLPLARKIASSVGIAEVALLEKSDNTWMPLVSGDLSLGAIARAHAWLLIPGGSEGFAAGALVDAYLLWDHL